MMRLPETIRAAFVIGRRDFVATVFSKTFLFFLLGPLFPLVIAVLFSGIGAQVDRNTTSQVLAVAWTQNDFDRLAKAQGRLAPLLRGNALELERVDPQPDADRQRDGLLRQQRHPIAAVLDGSLANPRLTGSFVNGDARATQVKLVIDDARRLDEEPSPGGAPLALDPIRNSAASVAFLRGTTARAGQAVLFFATLLLAGMLLSQLIEEKANKVIEVLASAVPVDAIFLGKLFAMLAMSLLGISVWTGTALGGFILAIGDGLSAIPPPAVGWPLFIVLLLLYFSTSYLLIGAVFLGIGAHASTPREVQTMSMPVTMSQVLLFGFASLAVGRGNAPEALAAAVFPLSSPFAMIARAAESPAIWPHLVALGWQALWVTVILRLSARIFRRSVLKSGKRFRWPWQRKASLSESKGMTMTKSACAALLIFGLLMPAVVQAKDVPISQPTGDWMTDFGQDRCMLARPFETKLGKTFLRVEPDPITEKAEFVLSFVRGAFTDLDWGRLRLSVDEDKQKDWSTYQMYRANGEQRLIIIQGKLGDLPADRDFVLGMNFATKGSFKFPVGGWAAAVQQLQKCVDALRAKYGVTQASLDRIAHHAEGKPANFFSFNDYPVEANFDGRAGTTKILFWIETDGTVSTCNTIVSSGVSALDEAACGAVIKRAKYKPATDGQFHPVREPTTLQIRWLRSAL